MGLSTNEPNPIPKDGEFNVRLSAVFVCTGTCMRECIVWMHVIVCACMLQSIG